MKFTVTKRDIERHWNGFACSCPIHSAIKRKMPESRVRVLAEEVFLDGRCYGLPKKAKRFSTNQSSRFINKRKALRVLKPFSFSLPVKR